MPTRTDLITAALELLQADGGAGQSPAPEDVAQIEAIIDGQLDALEVRRIITVADRQNFEQVVIDPLAVILANVAAPKYGQPRDENRRIAAENMLREMRGSDWLPSDVIPSLYY